jgi:hypothetical protein
LVRRPVDSEGVGDLTLLEGVSCASDDVLFENKPDSRLLDFFLSPNIVMIGRDSAPSGTVWPKNLQGLVENCYRRGGIWVLRSSAEGQTGRHAELAAGAMGSCTGGQVNL